jgi:hypothetical protein
VWDHFELSENVPSKVFCNSCSVHLSYNKSTTAMLKHLRTVHQDSEIPTEQTSRVRTTDRDEEKYLDKEHVYLTIRHFVRISNLGILVLWRRHNLITHVAVFIVGLRRSS